MSNDRKVYGDLTVHPPLTWKQIRTYQGQGGLVRESLRFKIEETTEETDEGSFVHKTCALVEPADWENSYGVVGALKLLAGVAPKSEFVGDITIVTEYPEFDEDPSEAEAHRYSISEGKLYVMTPRVKWTAPEVVK